MNETNQSNLELSVESEMDFDTSSETTQYAKLLKQVENLKIENTSLKKELNSNTSQINRLELEATTLKEIVVELKKSISSQKNVDNQGTTQTATNLNLKYGQFLSLSMDPENIPFLSTKKTLNSVFVNSSCFVDSELDLKQKINTLQSQRCTILEFLKKEEIAKESYMCKLNDLNDKLNTIMENNQSSFHDKKSYELLDCDISKTQKKILKDLGTNRMMKQRAQDRLQQIRFIDSNLKKLFNQLNNQESFSESTYSAGDTTLILPNSDKHGMLFNLDVEKRKIECDLLNHLYVIRRYCTAHHAQNQHAKEGAVMNSNRAAELPSFIDDDLLHSIYCVMEHSYHEAARVILNKIGGLYCTAELLILNHAYCRAKDENKSYLLRQWASLTLTNLTFQEPSNKTILMNMQNFLETVIDELKCGSEEIQQGMSAIVRNLSWKPDRQGEERLRELGVMTVLCEQVMRAEKEPTLASMLGALWNLTGHSELNRKDFCAIEGAVPFLVSMLTYNSPTQSGHVMESASGVLRNVSSVIAESDQYRQVLRDHDCLRLLLDQLTSPSLTAVSNACATLWNLSAHDATDQRKLKELGAVGKLKKLVQSKHVLIAQGSSGALRNLLGVPSDDLLPSSPADAKKKLPLQARRLKQMKQQLRQSTAECSSELAEVLSMPRTEPRTFLGLQDGSISTCQSARPAKPSAASCDARPYGWSPHRPRSVQAPQSESGALPQSVTTLSPPNPGSNLYAYESIPVRTWGKESNASVSSSSGMPTDLARKLQDTYDDYPEDDNPINYSLQFTEAELGSSTVVSNVLPVCKTTSLQSNARRGITVPPAPRLDLCEEQNIDGPRDQYHVQSKLKIDSSVEEKLVLADKQIHEAADDAPTDFTAIYTEECLDEECVEGYSSQPYPGPSKKSKNECTEKYEAKNLSQVAGSSLVNLPNSVTFHQDSASKSVERDGPNPATDRISVNKAQAPEAAEEDDKFSGVITPRHYFSKSNRHSGYMTPKQTFQETPMMMYSPMSSSRSSLDSVDQGSFRSNISSEFDSKLQSGYISPSDLPDSPGQSMPQSRCRSPRNLSSNKAQAFQPSGLNINTKLEQRKANHSSLRGRQLIEKAHVLSPAYLADMPPSDEMKCFSSEPAMSVMTGLSDLSVEGEKIEVSKHKALSPTSKSSASKTEVFVSKNALVAKGPGYVTSLPSSDEIKNFCDEGTLSPFVGLSEISALQSHNEGFQKNPVLFQGKTRKLSNRNSYTSRSSATGASAPLPPVSQQDEAEDETPDDDKAPQMPSQSASVIKSQPEALKKEEDEDKIGGGGDSNNPTQARTTSDCRQQPPPVFMGLKTLRTFGYVPSMPSSDEIHTYQLEEGMMSPMTTLSEISVLKPPNDGFQKPDSLMIGKTPSHPLGEGGAGKSDNKGVTTAPSASSSSSPASANHKADDEATKRADDLEDSDISFSDDDDGLLEQVIESAIPKKKTSTRSRSTKPSNPAGRRDKPPPHKHSGLKSVSKKSSTQSSDNKPPQTRSALKLDTRDRLAAADSRLNGMNIIDYIEHQMETIPGEGRGSSVNEREGVKPGNKTGRQVIEATETLSGSYSVLKQLRVAEKTQQGSLKARTSGFASGEKDPSGEISLGVGHNSKAHAFLHNRPTTFATEGTPIEISRCTSLSDLTIDSDHHNYDFAALKSKLGPDTTDTAGHDDVDGNRAPTSGNTFITTVCIEEGMRQLKTGGRENANDGLGPGTERSSVKNKKEPTPKLPSSPHDVQTVETLSGCESLLSSLDSDYESNLLKDCITSAMPVARKDFAAAIPPNQLVLQNEAYLLQNPGVLSLLTPPDHISWPLRIDRADGAATSVSPRDFIDPALASDPNQSRVDNVTHDDVSLSGSTGSLSVGGDAKSLMKTRNRAKMNSNCCASSCEIPSNSKAGRKTHRKQANGRLHDDVHQQVPVKDDSSRSSSYKYRQNQASESSPSPCSKCRHSVSRKLPGSSSMGKIESSSGRRRRRKNTTSSCTKPIAEPHCSHLHETRKPIRSRSAHAGYYSGVTRMYPRVDDSVMLSGVASMAARGEMVHCDGMQQLVPVNFPIAAYPRSFLLKPATFLQDQPNQALLQNGLHGIPATYQLLNTHPTAKKKKGAEKKKGGLKNRLKKLISPNNDAKPVNTNKSAKIEKAKKVNIKKWTGSKELEERGDPDTWLKKKQTSRGKNRFDLIDSVPDESIRSSSLSLSSSSDESEPGVPVQTFQHPPPGRSIYPTASSITPNHIPKSPAAKARFSVNPSKLRRAPNRSDSSSVEEAKHLRGNRVIQEVAPFNYTLPQTPDRRPLESEITRSKDPAP